VIVDGTRHLSAEVASRVQARVLPAAPGQTAAQLRAAVRRAVIDADPAGAEDRHRAAHADRGVQLYPEPDGMATLSATMSAPEAVACFERLTRLARGLGASDPRSMDARRADLLADLVLGRIATADATDGAGVRPVGPGEPLVNVVIDFDTLRGAAEHATDLAGYGPITSDAARAVAADAVWRRIVTDPLTGTVLDVGRTTYRPPAGLADLVRARDGTCRFPGCRRSAAGCELDHLVPFPDGPTSAGNLADECSRHHHTSSTPPTGASSRCPTAGCNGRRPPGPRTAPTRATIARQVGSRSACRRSKPRRAAVERARTVSRGTSRTSPLVGS
jgi:hypothetical protein